MWAKPAKHTQQSPHQDRARKTARFLQSQKHEGIRNAATQPAVSDIYHNQHFHQKDQGTDLLSLLTYLKRKNSNIVIRGEDM